ncbi:dihydrolipoyl dehydrogenase family protein [Demequina aurantiaca]|uniref:dihydrolipoyl dehydrogenase family protein n=1 Tax=Demequina aurantiaca TaxID=676200 RepID=UPI003D3579D0
MAETSWDLIVIGGGSAGLVASKAAANFGAKVLLIEKDRLGGDCLWTGCVPSKTLIAAAHVASAAALAQGVRPGQQRMAPDFLETMRNVDSAVQTIAPTDSREALEAEGVAVAAGHAHFVSERSISLDGEEITFAQALIATGTSPTTPQFEGAEGLQILNSASFWDLRELPEEFVILGGGAIGCELGQAMARLGSKVTIVQRGPRILPKEEEAAARVVHDAMVADGVTIITGRSAVSVSTTDNLAGTLTLDDGQMLRFGRLAAALGRRPETAALGLDAAGVATDNAGFVSVDAALRTANKRVWAAGDITGMPQFTHTAGVNGSVAATNAILGLRRKAQTRVIPRVTFTSPEVAAVGITASDAEPGKHRVVTIQHAHTDRAITESATSGFTQIVVENGGRVVGGTIVGPRAGETIGELTLAVHQKLSTSAIASAIHPYPTYSDALWNAAVADVRRRLDAGVMARAIKLLSRVRLARMR